MHGPNLLNFKNLFPQKAPQSLRSWRVPGRAGDAVCGAEWPWGRKRRRLGPGSSGCASCRLNHERGADAPEMAAPGMAAPEMAAPEMAAPPPLRQPLCNHLRAPCPCAWGLVVPPSPFFRHLSKDQGLNSSTESRTWTPEA